MNRRWQRFLALCLTALLVVTQLQPALAGLNIGGFEIPTSPGDLTNIGKQKAEEAAYTEIGKALGVSDPLRLDQKTAYKKVEVKNFQPQKLEINSIRDLLKPLSAGDYVMDIIAYCTQWSIHVPGRGMAYKLAPLQGKAAPIISAVLFRGALVGIPPTQLQAISWRIQGGVPISQWSEAEQKLADKLIPEYKEQLKGDLLQDYQNQYASFRGKVPIQLPSFDEALGKLGSVGKTIVEVKRVHQTLTDRTIAAERLPDMLYEHTDNQPRILPALAQPENLQWNEIRKGVYASFVVQEGNLGNNQLNFRITPEALSTHIPANGVRVASSDAVALQFPSISTLDVLGHPATVIGEAANDNFWLRLVVNNTSKGSMTLAEAAIALPEAELLAILGGLSIAYDIGYAIGQHGAQALIAALRTPQKQDKANNDCEKFRQGRAEYEARVRNLTNVAQKLEDSRLPINKVAETVSGMRREFGRQAKTLTEQLFPPSTIERIYARNIKRYQDALGPTYQQLLAEGKSNEQIIVSAARPDGSDIIPELEAELCKK